MTAVATAGIPTTIQAPPSVDQAAYMTKINQMTDTVINNIIKMFAIAVTLDDQAGTNVMFNKVILQDIDQRVSALSGPKRIVYNHTLQRANEVGSKQSQLFQSYLAHCDGKTTGQELSRLSKDWMLHSPLLKSAVYAQVPK